MCASTRERCSITLTKKRAALTDAGVLVLLIGVYCSTAIANDEIRIEGSGLTTVHEAVVSAEEAGTLVNVSVKEGVEVKQGDLLARIQDSEAKLELEQAWIDVRMAKQLVSNDAELRLAKKELELALSDLKRNEESNQQLPNSVPEARLERLRLLVERERFKVEKAEQEMTVVQIALESARIRVMLAQARLDRRQLRAPIRGVVVEVLRRKGEWVQAGEPVARILQYEKLRTEAYVDAAELAFAASGCPAVFQTDVPGYGRQEFRGEVTFVSPEANPVNRQVRVVAEIDNRDGKLRPGYLGTLVIQRRKKASSDR